MQRTELIKSLNINKFSAISVILLLVSVSLLSQPKIGTITGSVIDKSTGKPIENADVSLVREKDSSVITGVSTDANGKYTLTNVPPGKFILRANLAGYNFATVSGITINRDSKDITLDPIILSQGTTTTEEILVEEEKSIIEFKPDKKVFNVSKNLTTQGSTLLDLLKEVPSVNVDQDGNVSLRGSEGVKILVDGRPFGLEGQNRNIILEQIPASNVESIELITNPSAKYEAEGTVGIINVVLKKNKNPGFGYNGTLGLNMGTGDKYNGQFSISLKNNKFNLYGNYSYDSRNSISSGFNNRNYYTTSSVGSMSQLDSGKMRGKSHMFKLGLDYNIDKKNMFGLSFNFRNSNRSRGNTSLNKEFDISGGVLSDYYIKSDETDKGFLYDLKANFMHNFSSTKQVLSADISYSKDKDDETEINSESFLFPANNTPEKRNEYSAELDDALSGKIDYVHPISKDIKLEAGYKGSYKKRDIDYRAENFDYNLNQFVTDYNQSNRFVYKEQVHALYGIYTQQLGSFGYSVGGRVEQTIIRGELLTGGQNFDRNYIDFFPSLSLSQKLGKTSELQLSYSRRINRPRHRQLNPFRSYMGSNNYSEGNPKLNPEFTNSFGLDFIQYFRWAAITPGIFYRQTTDEISRTRTLIDSVTTLNSFVNLNSSKSYGGELMINSQPVKFISLNGTFSYYKTEVDASNFQSGLTNSTSSWTARSMATITLPAEFILQMNYFYMGKRVTAQGTMEPFQSFDAAIKKELFNKRLSLSLRVNDILNNARFRIEFNDQYFSEVMERRRDSRTVNFNITYNFGQKDDDKSNKRKKKNDDDNGNDDFEF